MSPWDNMPDLLEILESRAMDSDAMAVFADNLRRLRNAVGLTQEQLGDAAGISRTTIADYERGAQGNVELRTIEALAKPLNSTPDDLLRPLPVGFVVIPKLLAEYEKRYALADDPKPVEMDWLRKIPPVFWFGGEATPEAVHDLILHYRKRHGTP